MIQERYMVQGARNDNNKQTTVYYHFLSRTYPGDHDHHFITEAEARDPRKGPVPFEVRPGTVEPVAVSVKDYDAESMTGLCPNCGTLLSEIQGGPAYCKYCGQRLDWKGGGL